MLKSNITSEHLHTQSIKGFDKVINKKLHKVKQC